MWLGMRIVQPPKARSGDGHRGQFAVAVRTHRWQSPVHATKLIWFTQRPNRGLRAGNPVQLSSD
jgi:hypothetical protein